MSEVFKITAFVIAITTPVSTVASTAFEVSRWFYNMNYSDVTEPGVYEGQSARYATFGGISARAPITQPFRFADIQTPKFSAGCGGIDFYAGGFSAIDADQFIDNLRAIGQNAQSLAFMLAIQIVSPQLAGVMEDIQTFANKYLNMNMNSCEAATSLVGGAMDYFGAKEGNCTVKRMQNFGEDYNTANYACTTGGRIKSTENDGDANKIDFIKGNLTWYVLMQDPFFRHNLEFAEIILNLTGTVIISDADHSDDGGSFVRIIKPAIDGDIKKERFRNIYTALLMGGKATNHIQLYSCFGRTNNKYGCMRMSDSLNGSFINWTGLYTRIENLVASIVEKIYNDERLTREEQGFISSTSLPLYRYLAVTAAYFPRGTKVSRLTGDYTKLIAEDILLRSINAVIERVEQLSADLGHGMAEAKRIKEFRKDLQGVLQGLNKLKKENDSNIKQYFVMQKQIQLYEKALMSRLGSGIVTSAMWGK